jgi:Phytanoyl-CoA dioxygenase (PhyH)
MDMPVDARAVRSALTNDGYIVFRNAVPPALCGAVLDAMGQELGIWLEDPDSWDRISKEIDQVPLWGHQSQWNIRQLPVLHYVWSTLWGTEKLWADRNSCRVTPPWRPDRAKELPLHWDLDPRNRDHQWYQGILALTDAPLHAGGFRCAPSVMHNRDRWPESWPATAYGTEYWPDPVPDDEIVEVPLAIGDLLVFDNHLPHGTVRNLSDQPRAVFYLQMFPAGTPDEAAVNIGDHLAGIAPTYWRWKPGHDRVEAWPPATLNGHGQRLLGIRPW